MFTFFSSIIAFISTVVNFIINSIELIITTIISIGRAVVWLVMCIGYLPGWLTAFIIVPISLAVLFQILNKGS